MDKMPRKTKRRRKQRRFAFMAGFAALMAVALITLSMTVFFNIRAFSLEGDVKYGIDTIVECSGLSLGDNLFRMNKFSIERRLVMDLPYIKTAEIKRLFPEGLCFILTAAREAALLTTDGGYAVIDAQSKCLELVDDTGDAKRLPVIINAAVLKARPGLSVDYENPRTPDNLSELLSLFAEHGFDAGVGEIDMEKSYDMTFVYEDRVECHIGSMEYMDSKLRLIKEIISRYPENEKAVIDAQDYTTIRYKRIS